MRKVTIGNISIVFEAPISNLEVTIENDEQKQLKEASAVHPQANKSNKDIDYERECKEIKELFNLPEAEMLIAIKLDGKKVEDYAKEIGEDYNFVLKKYINLQQSINEILTLMDAVTL